MNGSLTRNDVGFPANVVKGDDFNWSPGCGGKGAGQCYPAASFSYMYWSIKVNPFSRRNTLLVLQNNGFIPYFDAGSDGFCDHSDGAQAPFDVYLFYEQPTGTKLDTSQAVAHVAVPNTATLPFNIEFLEANIPQPVNVDYERKIWVAVDLHQTGTMVAGRPQVSELMQTLKLNVEATP